MQSWGGTDYGIPIGLKMGGGIGEANINLAKSTFLIGQNNFGKSSVIRCLELLLSKGKK